MCGIVGKISFSGSPIEETDIMLMNRAVLHRGPDDSGAFISQDRKVGFGHQRLSIIDLSPNGHQPMDFLDRYTIVFNGEIYNFKEERERLMKEGFRFRSQTDTEVILALYHKYGPGCLNRLRGMFSFAIYDDRSKSVFCARDRVGKKPFKYYFDQNVFIFASELKAILTQPEYHKEPDFEAIHHYLTLQYCPAPLTGFRNIQKLEAAHYLLIDLKSRTVKKERYWKIDYSDKLDLSEGEWKNRILEKLDEAVRIRMVSDVPLGAFLSGGVDSSAIVALMSRNSPRPIKTFSIGFEERSHDETSYARMVADRFGTDHTEFFIKPEAAETLPALVRQFEEPFADCSALATHYLSRLTRQHVTVALNGDGGDENFAGYKRYIFQKLALRLESLSLLSRNAAAPLLRLLSSSGQSDFFSLAYRFSQALSRGYPAGYLQLLYPLTDEERSVLYRREFEKKAAGWNTEAIITSRFKDSGSRDRIDQTLFTDFATYLPDDLMVKVDLASMFNSLEARSPLLDHEFLELTARIPSALKLKGFRNTKHIFKKSLEGILPDDILFRPKKGFDIPIGAWFRKELKDYAYGHLLSSRSGLSEIFERDALKRMLDRHTRTRANLAPQIWTVLMLKLWLDQYFD